MSTITKELAKLFRKITNSEIDAEGNAHVVLSPADSLLINNARIALASLEAEAVACIDQANLDYLESGDATVWPATSADAGDVLLYSAPQPLTTSERAELENYRNAQQVVPVNADDNFYSWFGREWHEHYQHNQYTTAAKQMLGVMAESAWKAGRRAAMLQSGNHTEQHLDMVNSQVIPDDVSRMDWLVSKTVDVREPMAYGSHSLFWSQTITDEEDDYHATKLREQIDAAMAVEQAAEPQQEVK